MNENIPARFTLVPGHLYAAEFTGDEFTGSVAPRSCSPVLANRVQAVGNGQRRFELSFYQANYPEGVRDKKHTLQTLERGTCFILAKSTTHQPVRLLLIYDISWKWLRQEFGIEQPPDEHDIVRWLSSNL